MHRRVECLFIPFVVLIATSSFGKGGRQAKARRAAEQRYASFMQSRVDELAQTEWVDETRRELTDIRATFDKLTTTAPPAWKVTAHYQVGCAHQHFARALTLILAPEEMSDEDQQRFLAKLASESAELESAAVERFRKTLELGANSRAIDESTTGAVAMLRHYVAVFRSRQQNDKEQNLVDFLIAKLSPALREKLAEKEAAPCGGTPIEGQSEPIPLVSRSKALTIAKEDAAAASIDLSPFQAVILFDGAAWRVDYESHNGDTHGPRYVIDGQTGEVLFKIDP